MKNLPPNPLEIRVITLPTGEPVPGFTPCNIPLYRDTRYGREAIRDEDGNYVYAVRTYGYMLSARNGQPEIASAMDIGRFYPAQYDPETDSWITAGKGYAYDQGVRSDL